MISDEKIAQAAEELALAINASLPAAEECTHQFSKKFERKMKRQIYRVNHAVRYRVFRSAAAILLVMLLGFCSILAVSVEARENVFGWVRRQYDSFYEYFFDAPSSEVEPAKYAPQWMPDGYVYTTTYEIIGGESQVYIGPNGEIGEVTYVFNPDNFSMFIENVDCEQKTVWINGLEGMMYISPDPARASGILWTDASTNTLFHVAAPADADTLMKIAENVKKVVE